MSSILPSSADSGTQPPRWDLVIRPQRRWFELDVVELWRYRDLIRLLVRRDFVAQYTQTILGPLWHVVNPVLTTFVFTLVFSRIAGLSTDGVPAFLFYLSGSVIWNYFARCLTTTSATLTSNAGLFGKVYFPRLVMPLAALLTHLIAFGIQFALFLVALAYFSARGAPVHVTMFVFLAPLALVVMAALGLGLGIAASALTARYRDLVQVIAFAVTLLMYVTPVIYPMSAVPARYRAIVAANPIAPVVEGFRYAFLGRGTHSLAALGYSAVCAAAALALGLVMFARVERTFIDTI